MYRTIKEAETYRLGSKDDPRPTLVHFRRASARQVEVAASAIERQRRETQRMNRDPDDAAAVSARMDQERAFLTGQIIEVRDAYELDDRLTGEAVAEWIDSLDDYAYGELRAAVRGQRQLTAFEAKS